LCFCVDLDRVLSLPECDVGYLGAHFWRKRGHRILIPSLSSSYD